MNKTHTKNAYENIKKACEERLAELYPVSVPDMVRERLGKELEYLKKTEAINDFELARLLYAESRRASQYITCRGNVMGSLIFYLISRSRVNPCQAHYYCPKCGYYEEVDSRLFGIDLPSQKCPSCGETMEHNGFNLSIESVWGSKGEKTPYFEYNVSADFYPFIKRLLQKAFPNNEIAPFGLLFVHNDKPSRDMRLMGYIILSEGQTMDDYPDMQGYLQNGDMCLTGNLRDMSDNRMKKINFLSSDILTALMEMQKRTGIYIEDIAAEDIQDITWKDIVNTRLIEDNNESIILEDYKPQTVTDIINLITVTHATFVGDNINKPLDKIYEIKKRIDSTKIRFYSRDDIFEELLKLGIERKIAFEFSEYVRKGKASKPDAYEYDSLELPEEFKNIVKTILYLFPRAHIAEAVTTQALLSYYLKTNSKEYAKMIRSL